MKKTVLFSLLALSVHVFADSEVAATDKRMNGRKEQMSEAQKKEQQMMRERVTLTSARPESDNGWYLFADALYWHADVGSSEWATKVISNPNGGGGDTDVHSLNFKWSWGFKVGIGANIDHDMWDTNVYYTWFRTANSNAAALPSGAPAGSGVVENLGVFGAFTSGRIHWNIHYSMFDWELGRWSYVSKNLALRPHVGVKGGWINQKIKANFEVPVLFTEHFKNDFWGVGPSAGVNTLWILGNAGSEMQHRFCLFGDVAGALMYGHFKVTHNPELLGAFKEHARGLTRNLAVTMLQGIMGLSWDTGFNRDRNHFMLRVGYEFQYWFRQNQLIQFSQNLVDGVRRISDDLALQGITADFRFDF